MKSPVPAIFAALLAFALAACGPGKVRAPAPNPVGQWQWSNNALGSWQLEIKADGTFQRVVTNPLGPQSVAVSGRWILNTQPEPSWLERQGIFQKNSIDDEMLRTAGVEPGSKNIQWSAPATLALFYTVPRGTELAPGAAWTGAMLGKSGDLSSPASSPEMEIEERHAARTHTNTSTGEVFLDLAGKTFQKAEEAGTKAAVAAGSAFLTVEPFEGITLDLPAAWQYTDPDAAEKHLTPVPAIVGKPRLSKMNSTSRFVPPGKPQDVYILVSVQPNLFSAKQLADASQIDLERFAEGFVKGASHALEAKGYFLERDVKAERTAVGQRSAILCVGETIDPTGSKKSIRVLTIPTESATIMMACCSDVESGAPWKPIIERACATLRIADTFAVPPR